MSDFIDDKVSVVNKARDKAIVTVKDYARPQIISSIFEMMIAIVMIMGVQLIRFGFNIDALYHWKFWARIGCLSIAIFMIYRAVINGRFHKTSQREDVVAIRNEYNSKNDKKDLDMKVWLKNVYNLQTKIDTYVAIQNRKILKVENKLIKCTNPKRIVKLESKLEFLKKTITNEYIMENIDKIRVKYYVVFYSDFMTESTYGDGTVSTRSNYGSEFNKSSFKKIWMYVLSSVLLGMSTFLLEDYTVATVLASVGSTAFMVTTRIMSALMEAPVLYDKTITASYIGRIQVLDEYSRYKAEHPSTTKIEHEINIAKENMREEIKAEVRAELDIEYKKKLEEQVAMIKDVANKTLEKNVM